MAAGRRAVPTALKEIAGNPGKRPLNRNEPKCVPMSPEPPSWLMGEALRFWNELIAVLLPMGHLSESDSNNVATLAMALAQLKEGHAHLELQGYVVDTSFGPKTNPYVGVVDKAQKQIKSLLCELGMTPASRSKMVALTGAEEQDPLSNFLSRGRKTEEEPAEDSSGSDVH